MRWTRAKLAMAVVACGALPPAPARAVPVDLTDPTPRTVRLEIDQEQHDYGFRGGAYTLPLDAAFTSDGTTATIDVDGSAVGAFVNEYFAGAASVVPGSFSDYVVTIDVASGAVLSASVSGTLSTVVGDVPIAQTASSSDVAGWQPFDFMGFTFPLFCTSGDGCTLVPGAPYDPLTGTANAVGIIVTSLFDTFTPFGDIRLSELPPIGCSTAIDAKDYVPGETVRAGFDIRSAQATTRAVEMKVWIERGDGLLVSAINRGAAGDQPLVAGEDGHYAEAPLFTVTAGTALGAWSVGCRVLDPITGEVLAEDRDPFTVLTTR
jgi:hypothetical protein